MVGRPRPLLQQGEHPGELVGGDGPLLRNGNRRPRGGAGSPEPGRESGPATKASGSRVQVEGPQMA